MNAEALKDFFDRLPLGMIMALYAGYLGYDYYSFTSSPDSPLMQSQAEYQNVKRENDQLQAKIKQANEFFRSLDAKKADIRRMAQSLQELKGTLSSEIDVPGFMKMVVTEARRVGLTVVGMKPVDGARKEYYVEQPFEMTVRGVYVQLLVFLERMANVQNIVRVEDYDLRPVTSSSARFVELQGVVRVKAYQYVGTKADEIGKDAKAVAGGTR